MADPPPEKLSQEEHLIQPLRHALIVGTSALVCGIVALATLAVLAHRTLANEVRDGLLRIAAAAASQVDGDLHASLQRPDQWYGPEYQAALAPLERLHSRTQDLAYLYTLTLIGGLPHFVLDTAPPGELDEQGIDQHSYLLEPYPDADEYIYLAFAEGRPQVTSRPYEDRWGTFMSAYAPFFDGRGRLVGVVGVDMDLAAYKSRLATMRRATALGALAAGLIALAMGSMVYSQQQQALRGARRRVALTKELQSAKQVAEDADRAKSQFLANISHELRTPMTSILGFSDLLADGESDEDQSASHIRTIRRSAQHLLELINDLLDLSRIDAMRVEIAQAPYDPAQLVLETLQSLAPRANQKGIRVEVAWMSPLPNLVSGDAMRVRQVLLNLASNAVKFTERGSVSLEVEYRETPSGQLCFTVRDTGIGIPEDKLETIFEAFAQADPSTSRKFGGTGLGLAISRRLATLMGGGVVANSDGHSGSTFVFWFDAPSAPQAVPRQPEPCVVTSGGEIPAPVLPRRLHSSETRTVAPTQESPLEHTQLVGRVLVAEDGPDNRLLVHRILSRAGLEVSLAEDGVEALERLEAAQGTDLPFDLLVTDIQMPRMDGLELAREVRRRGWDLPILALTAHAMEIHQRQCLEAGCDAHATKPIHRKGLLVTIESLLDRARTTGRGG